MSVLGSVERRAARPHRPGGTTPAPRPGPDGRGDGSSWGPWVVRLGVLLIVAGLSVFAWIGWQLYGTNWVSHHTQRDLVDQLEREWRKPVDNRAEVVETSHGSARAIVRIPKLGDDYAIPVVEGTSAEALASGFGHYSTSAAPGEVGNFALAGHRITHGEPLRDMPSLVVGDRIEVETARFTYVYELTSGGDDLVVPASQTWVVDPVPDNPEPGGIEPLQRAAQRLITLTSCSELFHTDNRFVAFGHLVATIER